MSWTSNMPEFRNALRKVVTATNKDGALIVNKALKDVAFRAMSFTPKGDPAQIEAELMRDKLALKIVSKRLKKRVGSSFTVGGKSKGILRVTRAQIATEARKLIEGRKRRRGFMRAGWIPAIKRHGGSIQGERPKSPLSKLGEAKLATPEQMSGEIANFVYDRMSGPAGGRSRAAMEAALARAVQFVAADREEYARRKIEQTLKEHSD